MHHTRNRPWSISLHLLRLLCFFALISPAYAADVQPPASPERIKFFENKVRPLLADNCFSCHAEKKQKGQLRLDSLEAVLKGGKNGVVMTPGKPESSRLITAINYKDEDLQMPPDGQLAAEQIQILTDWIKMGAPWSDTPTATTPLKGKHRTINDADRAFWSFQPVKNPSVPSVPDQASWCKTPVDNFILAKLEAESLTPAPEAERIALIRRATFDLHGLPPTPEEVDAFVNDASPAAYDKLIDRLLASPRYGEHWARHWLDVVRYAESDGFKQDAYRPNAWRYRDYVVKAFNDDKPYDRFVREQLAGDEIAPNEPDVIVATGYLRHGGYEYNQRDVPKQWQQILDDVTDVTGDAFLGLSMGCARCHDHKFDPILQADYYRLQSFLAPMVQRDDVPLATETQKADHAAKMDVWLATAAPIQEQIKAIERSAFEKNTAAFIKKFPPEMQAIIHKPAAERSPLEEQWAELAIRQINDQTENPQPKLPAAEQEKYSALKKQLTELEAERPKPLAQGLLVSDVGTTPPQVVLPNDPAHPLEPKYLSVLENQNLVLPVITPTATTTGRRTALANWLTQPDHPLTTRVIVNRIWQYHFGKGLVATSSDFGRLGSPPSHPDLLDYLAHRFVETDWSIKQMQRLIMTSATYRQSALRPMPEQARVKDPENRWLWRMNSRRLDAEQVRDSILAASGELKLGTGGPGSDLNDTRRTIYTKTTRNNRDPLLDVFDAPESYGSIPARNVTTTATQALFMMNANWPLKRASALAARVQHEALSADPAAVVTAAYRHAFGRVPSATETEAALTFLQSRHSKSPATQPTDTEPGLIDFCHALLNSNEFIYVD